MKKLITSSIILLLTINANAQKKDTTNYALKKDAIQQYTVLHFNPSEFIEFAEALKTLPYSQYTNLTPDKVLQYLYDWKRQKQAAAKKK